MTPDHEEELVGISHVLSQSHEPRYRSFLLCLACLTLVNGVSNVIAPVVDMMGPVYNVPEKRLGGLLAGCFYFSGLLGAALFGWLSSFMSRKVLTLFVCVICATGCVLTGLPDSFELMMVMRTIAGFGYGGILPIANSLIGDWFPAHSRTAVAGILVTMQGLGIFLGHEIAAALKNHWKVAFVVVGLPVLFLGVFNYLFAEEPERGGMEEGFEGRRHFPGSRSQQIKTLKSKSNILVMQIGFPGNIPSAVLLSFLNLYLVDREGGLGMSVATVAFAEFAMGLGFFLGTMFGGLIGTILYNKDPRYAVLYCATTCTIRAIPAFFIVGWRGYVGLGHPQWLTALMFLMGFLATQHAAVTTAILLNVNLPETRGTVAAMGSVLDDVSRGVGPYVFSLLSGVFGDWTLAFQICLVFWVLSGMLLIPVCDSLIEDIDALKKLQEEINQEGLVVGERLRADQEIRERVKDAAAVFKVIDH